MVGRIEGKRVLDVGCGFGRESIMFAQRGAIVHAVDLSEESISRASELAQRIGVNVTFQVGNIDLIDYDEDYFDVIFNRAILHHLPDPTETLLKLSCFIRPDGLLIAQEPRLENPFARVGRRFFNPSTTTEHPFKHGELESIFAKAFDKVSVKYFFVLAPLCFAFGFIRPLRSRKLQNTSFAFLHKVDEALFRGPFLRKYAWLEIVHSVKHKAGKQ